MYKAIDNKKACLGIFIDLQKACNTESYALLINKIEKIGTWGIKICNLGTSAKAEKKCSTSGDNKTQTRRVDILGNNSIVRS